MRDDREGRAWLNVYHGLHERVADVAVSVKCGEAFDEGCGDCLVCFDDCDQMQHRFVHYTDEPERMERFFGPFFALLAPPHIGRSDAVNISDAGASGDTRTVAGQAGGDVA